MVTLHGGSLRRTAIGALAGAIAVALLAALVVAPGARAAEILYWDNYSGDPDNVGFANIDGSGGGLLNQAGLLLSGPEGMAYDTASNRLFVANEEGAKGSIIAINADGSGAAPFTAPGALIEEPEGVAVDPATGTIYWENVEGGGSIAWAKLDGSAGGLLNITGTTFSGPCCRIAIDQSGGRVYWVNTGATPNTINYANLNNSGGGGVLNTAGSTVEPGGEGLAVDNASGRLYFLGGTNEVGFANLNNSGGGNVSLGGAIIKNPWGLAFDPSISRLYWANEGNPKGAQANAFGFTGLAGGPSGNISIATTLVGGPQDPVIIKSPSGTGAPTITAAPKKPAALTCSTGTWAADYPGSFVYQAPRTLGYQWTLDGKPIGGATAATFEAKSAGSYACIVTAANQAGAAAQTSAATKIDAAKAKLTVKTKTVKAKAGKKATFKVQVQNQGDLKSGNAKLCLKAPKKAKGVLKAKCASLGKLAALAKKTARLRVRVGPTATGTYKLKILPKGISGKAAKAKLKIVG